jgi:hypothetical protein
MPGALWTHAWLEECFVQVPRRHHCLGVRRKKEDGMAVASGDMLTVLGSRITMGGISVVLAREITRGDKTWTLRDPAGVLLWNPRGGLCR